MLVQLIFVVALIALFLVVRASIRSVRQSQRLVIERFGRFLRCGGPGMHAFVPFIESGRLIDLNEYVHGWQSMTEPEIQQRLLAKLYG